MTGDPEPPRDARTPAPVVALASAAAAALSLVAKLPQLGFAHREPDEVVYWQLAQNLWQRGDYSLAGTRILELLPPSMYDHAAFHHPPLFALLLGPWVFGSDALYPPASTLWLPWLAHALFAAAAVALGLRFARGRADLAAVALAVGAVALDPFGWFASRFLWIDAVAMGLAAAAGWCSFGAAGGGSGRARLAAGGTLAALAALSKLTAALVLPFLVWERLRRGRDARLRGDLLALCVPAVVGLGAWFAWFHAQTGALLPTWLAPGDDVLARDALMRSAFERTPLAYAWIVPWAQPLVVWVAAAALARRDALRGRGALVAWFVVGIALVGATTALGATPVLTRSVAAALPALYVLAVALVVERRGLAWRASFALCAALAAWAAWRDVHGDAVYELRGVLG